MWLALSEFLAQLETGQTSEKTRIEVPKLNVTSVREMTADCPAAK